MVENNAKRRSMKKIGVLGGLAWPSTAEYYATICRWSEELHASSGAEGISPTPEFCIESLNLAKALSLLGTIGDEGSWARFDAYHRDGLKRLEISGAAFAVIASNTPHHRFDAITRDLAIPTINIFETVADRCAALGIEHVLILGTSLTMKSQVFVKTLARCGIGAFAPEDDEQRSVAVLIREIQRGNVIGAAKRIGDLAKAAFARHPSRIPAVCLACTELPLAFPEERSNPTFEAEDICYINTLAAHARAAFEAASTDPAYTSHEPYA